MTWWKWNFKCCYWKCEEDIFYGFCNVFNNSKKNSSMFLFNIKKSLENCMILFDFAINSIILPASENCQTVKGMLLSFFGLPRLIVLLVSSKFSFTFVLPWYLINNKQSYQWTTPLCNCRRTSLLLPCNKGNFVYSVQTVLAYITVTPM